jgi:hypothetical protein
LDINDENNFENAWTKIDSLAIRTIQYFIGDKNQTNMDAFLI